MKVFIVVGWFGDQEWVEEVCATQEKAEERISELLVTRSSDKGPVWANGLHKFGFEEWAVIE